MCVPPRLGPTRRHVLFSGVSSSLIMAVSPADAQIGTLPMPQGTSQSTPKDAVEPLPALPGVRDRRLTGISDLSVRILEARY